MLLYKIGILFDNLNYVMNFMSRIVMDLRFEILVIAFRKLVFLQINLYFTLTCYLYNLLLYNIFIIYSLTIYLLTFHLSIYKLPLYFFLILKYEFNYNIFNYR